MHKINVAGICIKSMVAYLINLITFELMDQARFAKAWLLLMQHVIAIIVITF